MTEATRREPGTPCWASLMVQGLDATEEFYGELFGWEFRPGPPELGPYVRALLDGREVAGIGRLPAGRGLPGAWTTYLASDDADRTAESVRYSGGTVAVGPLDAGGAGRLAICSDPCGAVFGVWQAASFPGTAVAGVRGVSGVPVWNELLTYESEQAVKFYRTVFDYEAGPSEPAGEDRAVLLVEGLPAVSVRGVGAALPRDRGAHWTTWFEVADPDASARRVEELGGRTLCPPQDGPEGRRAVVADPEGAAFTIVRSPGR
ncbi:VOC family protein [Streptomyces somaliensis DSM 40738]|uniref:VOC family protein n=1 Tax=Streptomyces somaliensis (strain ATCC 33201 / DSM 40738 / JCM 12659 / KCTC 9044 / NCTC 11332 / NRRL B-12077 / IP 733) TaxID=1134445 RepID=A0AA44DD69_STRE0|nr:VOC family protein [Streptomyces somaliensis]MCQ0024952.1 VOC family protein [Streptomyces somaliensis DSM 40738]NKY14021.1 VOC family protein [Streptomyces somaliensis DSM 40738]